MNRFRTLSWLVIVVSFTACEVYISEPPEQLFSKAEESRQAEQFTQALSLYRKAADQGHGGAQMALGAYYDVGAFPTSDRFIGTTRTENMDVRTAQKWYRRAAATLTERAADGDAEAQLALGTLYFHGRGVDFDFAEARRLFQQAARQGEPRAYFSLGWLSISERNDEEAAYFFHQSAELGHVPAYRILAFHYLYGRGVEQSLVKSVEMLQAAIAKGSAEAQVELDEFLEGIRNAAAAGNADSQQHLRDLAAQGLI